jgi:hypothetical protein
MIRFSKLAAALAVLPVMAFASPVLADSPGHLESGNLTFRVRNATQNGDYSNSTSVACNEELVYSVRLHNTDFGALNNIQVKANLISGDMTATPDSGAAAGITGHVSVTIPSGSNVAFESGSTTLYTGSGSVIRTLPDGITTVGVNAGTLNGSTTEFVIFKAKVACPPVTPQVSFACTELGVTNIDRTHYNFTAKGTASNAAITGYTFTTKDANGKVLDTFNNSTNSTTSGVYPFNQETGTYTVSAQLNTDHGSNSNSNCVKQITVAAVPATPTTPAAKAIPNTGAGDVLGIFAGASAAGTAAHAVVTRRFRR